MADWSKITSRGTVDDRRGTRMIALGGGGLSVAGVVIYLLLNFLGGGDLGDVLNSLPASNQAVVEESLDSKEFEGADTYEVFVSTVLGSTNDMWSKVFAVNNKTYDPPELVLFRDVTQSACGGASSESGPHYCPLDATIYLDETFFDELTNRLGAKGGDVAQAYVIAHEVGHHVQEELGIGDETRQANTQEASINLELQADCFAGLWAYSIKNAGIFEPGEIDEALDAAAAVGDDRIQKVTTGRIDPETWTHGSAAERVLWFNRGFESGKVSACDTFND